MAVSKELKEELQKLINKGVEIFFQSLLSYAPKDAARLNVTAKKKDNYSVHGQYQEWYSVALPFIRKFAPDRALEFCELYKADAKRKQVIWRNYTIEDFLLGLVLQGHSEALFSAFSARIQQQITILQAIYAVFDSSLSRIVGVVQADLFEHELQAALELRKKGHLRAAGAVSGVVLERHLAKVCVDHSVAPKKTNPTINDLNEALRNSDLIDVPLWRQIQRLGDIRNICVHSKDREPRSDEVEDLIVGTRKISSELF